MKNPMKKIVAVAVAAFGIAAFAEPSVKITKVKLADARDGTVECAYTVSGDFTEGIYDLYLTVSSDDGTKSAVLTNKNVTAGSKTEIVNVKTLLGKAYPGVSFFAKLRVSGVQLWKDGPYFAECNIGANAPEEYGLYFWWGDTVGYKRKADDSGWVSVDGTTPITFDDNDPANSTYKKDNATLKTLGYIDDEANPVLNAAHDAATVHLGAPWRMMTKAELDKLVDKDYCTRKWVTTYNGKSVNGYVVKGAKDPYKNNEVFFPAARYGMGSRLFNAGSNGYYWPSTPKSDRLDYAWNLYFYSGDFDVDDHYRYLGFSVRPVR